MQFTEFSKLLQRLESTASRNEMTSKLAEFLDSVNEDEIAVTMYLLIGRVVPTFVPFEFNFSTKLLLRSLSKAFNIDLAKLNADIARLGDIGLVAEEIFNKKKISPAGRSEESISSVYDQLYKLALVEGKGAQEEKQKIYIELVRKLDSISAKYVSRMITGKMRLGLSERTIIDALSFLISGDKSNKPKLEYAYGVRADIGEIAKLAKLAKKKNDIKLFDKINVEPGIPVASKLVQREKSVEAVFERLDKWIVQPKYDGLRTQIHFSKKGFKNEHRKIEQANYNLLQDNAKTKQEKVRIFSRNMEPLTDMFPDIVKAFENTGLDSVVLDSETIGYDAKKDKFIPFQETMTRKRKYGITGKTTEVPIKTFVFDVLYVNGKDVTQLEQTERLEILHKLFNSDLKGQSLLEFSKSTEVKELKALEKLFNQALKEGLEGVIVKDPISGYKPGTRNFDWIKLKANIDESLIDTIDCVVLGYYYGRGARAKFGAGAFLVGVYNKDLDRYETIAKVGSGIKDEEWPKIIKQVQELKVDEVPTNVIIKKELMPDIICRPEIVVVVDADEISKSGNHTAGMDKSGKGFSLRFPRLKEWGRLDKKPEDVTSVEEIKSLI